LTVTDVSAKEIAAAPSNVAKDMGW